MSQPIQQRGVVEPFDWDVVQGTLATTSTAMIANPAATAAGAGPWVIDKIILTQNSGSARTFKLRHLSGSDTDDDTANFRTDTPLASKESVDIDGPIVLKPGDTIKGLASAADVNYLISVRKYR